jgi:hypothetical protein
MIRWTQHSHGLRFDAACPDRVKIRAIGIALPQITVAERVTIPLCDQPFVTEFHASTRGWLVPFVGFVSDERLSGVVSKTLHRLAAISARLAHLMRAR